MAPPNSGHRRARPDPSPDWRLRAACRTHPHPGIDHAKERVDVYYSSPETDRGSRRELTKTEALAISICSGCSERVPCVEYAISAHEDFGIFGGLLPRQIRALRKRRRWQTADQADGEAS